MLYIHMISFVKPISKILTLIFILSLFFYVVPSSANPEDAAPDVSENSTADSTDSVDSTEDTEEKDTVMDTLLHTLETLTCEVEGVGNLLRSEFSHTCIPDPFLSSTTANLLFSPLYASTFMRLTLNDSELFPDACNRANRADFHDLKLSFSMCNNTKLAAARAGAIVETIPVISQIYLEGSDDPWGDINDVYVLAKSKYHQVFRDKREEDEGIMIDAGIIPFFPWKVIKVQDRLCVATRSFGGWVPIGCKYIKEPHPFSIYSEFTGINDQGNQGGELSDLTSLTNCGNMGSCYKRAYDNSKTGIVMTGPIIECVKEMIAKLMISSEVCNFQDVKQVLGRDSRRTSALFQFQRNMHQAVTALLTIYVILFGFKIVLAGEVPPRSELVIFVIKFIFVVYFSVGININTGSDNDLNRMDGMIEWAFPFLLNGMNQMSSWVMNSTPSGLCKFDDVYYPDSLKHLQLWDALDCKISHYLGLDAMQTMIIANANSFENGGGADSLSFPIPPYIYLLLPAVISGIPMLISLALMYPLLVISIGAFIVNATVVCMISIVILGVLAPLFVPLYLFNYTKGYFESWVKLLISFMLQPMVAVVFMTVMMSVYDYGFYGTCKYTHQDITYEGPEFNVSINTNIGSIGGGIDNRTVRYSYLDQDWGNYTEEERDNCRYSLGYMLNHPLFWAREDIDDNNLADPAKMPWINDTTGEVEKERFDFLDSVETTQGKVSSSVEVSFGERMKTLVFSMLTACLALYLMYHFSESLAEFAADMTEGASIGDIAMKPQAAVKAGLSAVSAMGGSSGGGDMSGGDSGGAERSGDSTSGGDAGASSGDSTSGGGGEAAIAQKIGGKLQGESGAQLESPDAKTGKAVSSAVKGGNPDNSADSTQSQNTSDSNNSSNKESNTDKTNTTQKTKGDESR